jgi:hypothetical protein
VNLAHHRGLLTGRHYALSLLRPASIVCRPRCPYWHPLKALVWRLGVSAGIWEVLAARKE